MRLTITLCLAALIAAPAVTLAGDGCGSKSTAKSATCGAAQPVSFAMDRSKDIVDTAVEAGSFKTLAAALQAAGLVETLKGDGPFTVFAPTDDAFAKLPKGTVESLLEPKNKAKLVAVLTYHVVPGMFPSSKVAGLDHAATVNGQSVHIQVKDGSVMIDNAKVVTADIHCSNGVIHVIDSVILPNQKNLVEVAVEAGSFKTLAKALAAADLVDVLKEKGPFTVFAPTDDAFAKLPAGTIESLLEEGNRSKLTAILKYHVVPGRLLASDVVGMDSVDTLQGSPIKIRVKDGEVFVNDARILKTDIQTANGVIHVIDGVILPPAKN